MPFLYEPRVYRELLPSAGLVPFTVKEKETDLYILARRNLQKTARKAVLKARTEVEAVIAAYPGFTTALKPFALPEAGGVVGMMIRAGEQAGVGPMAAVAGAIAEAVGRDLHPLSPEVLVENGGDIFLITEQERLIGVYAGSSPLSGRLGIKCPPRPAGWGICCSSGTVGHSLSFGRADAVIIVAPDAALADAAATATANRIQSPADLNPALEFARNIPAVQGALAIIGADLAAWGEIELTPLVSGA